MALATTSATAFTISPGPPYLPNTAGVGGTPTVAVDVPICSVLLVLYLIGVASHTFIFRHNQKIGEKFRLSILLIYMGFFRTITLSLRMAWSTDLANTRLAIAAQVFVTAGVLLLFILNLIFMLRLFRKSHPGIAYQQFPTRLFQFWAALVGLTLVAVITCFILSLYTLDTYKRQVDRSITLYGGTFFLVTAFSPVLFVITDQINRRRMRAVSSQVQGTRSMTSTSTPERKNRIMAGSISSGSLVLTLGALLLTIGAGFRIGTSFAAPRTADNPAWYHSKACFYLFNFVTEIMVIYLYALARVDRIFYVPDQEFENGRVEK